MIMGIVNVTPDSFSDGNEFFSPENALAQALKLNEQGADILDVGGESTRPGAETIDAHEETRRVIGVIQKIRQQHKSAVLSIDTRKASVARFALEGGCTIVNDVSGTRFDNEKMLEVVKSTGATLVIMHSRGDPKNMQGEASYKNVVDEVCAELDYLVNRALKYGVMGEQIWLDPGFGLPKNFEHNLKLFKNLSVLKKHFKQPLVVGVSRKKFVGELIDEPNPKNRLSASLCLAYQALEQGADVLRVHDVKETVDVLKTWKMIKS